MALIDVIVPDLGNFKDVPVVDVLVAVGAEVEVDTPLVTLETGLHLLGIRTLERM